MLKSLVFKAPTSQGKKGKGNTILTKGAKEQQHKKNNKSWSSRYLRSCNTNTKRMTTLV
jgi:hypothetical protein